MDQSPLHQQVEVAPGDEPVDRSSQQLGSWQSASVLALKTSKSFVVDISIVSLRRPFAKWHATRLTKMHPSRRD